MLTRVATLDLASGKGESIWVEDFKLETRLAVYVGNHRYLLTDDQRRQQHKRPVVIADPERRSARHKFNVGWAVTFTPLGNGQSYWLYAGVVYRTAERLSSDDVLALAEQREARARRKIEAAKRELAAEAKARRPRSGGRGSA
jgi:hypothetical protein